MSESYGGLADALRARVRGEVRFGNGDRALYSTDASNYRQLPIGVLLPRDADDVEATIATCRAFGAPLLSRGGGTSLAGQTCNEAVVIDMSKYMNRVLEINWDERWARVQPGTVLDDLRNAAEERHLTFGPDPATHNRNTIGGMIGNNSCGMHAQMAGKVEENVQALEVLTYDGLRMRVGATTERELDAIIQGGGERARIYHELKALRDKYAGLIRERFPDIPRRVSGFPLNQLLAENQFNVARALVGTESTCVTILEATVRLVSSPKQRVLAVFGFSDIAAAADAVTLCNAHGPIALEALDETMFAYMRAKKMPTESRAMFPDGGAWLIVEFGASAKEDAVAQARGLAKALGAQPHAPSSKIVDDAAGQRELWEVREAALGSASKVPGEKDLYPGWEDSAVAPERLGDYVRALSALLDRFGYHASLYGHFGQGCVHTNIDFDLFTDAGIKKYRDFVTRAAHICVEHGGSLSGEHGDGQARAELLPIMYGDELVRAFDEFKTIWDPRHKMNPGKVIRPHKLDDDLRWGPRYQGYQPQKTPTQFSFPDDRGSFAYAANRCVGTGKCRRHDGGTMCPSYMATREEKHSTRGRARLLFEMLEGSPMRSGWRDESVKEALDLCLACKGCRSECPVNVDMATYKAEFLSHYYAGRLRPLAAYAFGLMFWWARIASLAPAVANAVTQTPVLRDLVKALAHVAPQRRLPLFARRTFRRWFAQRPVHNAGMPRVVLWPDTWNDYFHPSTAEAAVQVLEAAGFQVVVPKAQLCCGRPLYDYGMLGLARRLLERVLDELRPIVASGAYVVGLEPSCVSVFRDELPNLFGGDADARRLADRTFMLSEFLVRHAPQFKPPKLTGRALVHGHCHQKSVLGFADEQALLEQLGLDSTILDSGCCGMAGAFGFERGEHYDVSIKCAERVLAPRVRDAAADTLIVSNGFSCREQIAQLTNRQAVHVAQVVKMALDRARE